MAVIYKAKVVFEKLRLLVFRKTGLTCPIAVTWEELIISKTQPSPLSLSVNEERCSPWPAYISFQGRFHQTLVRKITARQYTEQKCSYPILLRIFCPTCLIGPKNFTCKFSYVVKGLWQQPKHMLPCSLNGNYVNLNVLNFKLKQYVCLQECYVCRNV